MNGPVLRTSFALHMRSHNGSTYGDNIIDEKGNVVGARSQWLPKAKYREKKPPRTIYTLAADGSEHTTLDSFKTAYLKSIEGKL